MKTAIALLVSLLVCVALAPSGQAADRLSAHPSAGRDLQADTWVGQDALGRRMPTHDDVGPVRQDQRRVVGIFYVTWHGSRQAGGNGTYEADVTRILAADPTARLDANHPLWKARSYHWGEPEDGYFLSTDEYVIRKDMAMLADAGVDVLVMDVTNGVRYWEEWKVVFGVMEKMRSEGNRVPQFCFWAFNGPVITVVQELYDRIYQQGLHRDLWFHWEGKPLLLYNGNPGRDANGPGVKNPNPHYTPAARTDPGHPHYGDPDYTEEFYTGYTREVKEFFTLRTMWWGYWEWAGKRFVGTENNWTFGLDLGDAQVRALRPEQLVATHRGHKEQVSVTPAQHAAHLVGKSWSRENGQPPLDEYDLPEPTFVPWLGRTVERPEDYGIYFQQRWDEALQSDPPFIFINDWNEWTAGKHHPAPGRTFPFLRRASGFYFVDQYNAEFNRVVQPMKGGYTDNYYMQMVQNIRRYKGARPVPQAHGFTRISIDGSFADWAGVGPEYRDTVGDTFHRDHPGYGGLHYVITRGRNDIVSSKVAVGPDTVCFFVETREPLTPHTDNDWMLLLIDADQNPDTGWYGYDYLINQRVVDDRTTTLQRYDAGAPGDPWVEVARLKYRYAGRALELAVPRKLPGWEGEVVAFDFKWCDHPEDLKDPISLCVSGDTAPNRRFNYRYHWTRDDETPQAVAATRDGEEAP